MRDELAEVPQCEGSSKSAEGKSDASAVIIAKHYVSTPAAQTWSKRATWKGSKRPRSPPCKATLFRVLLDFLGLESSVVSPRKQFRTICSNVQRLVRGRMSFLKEPMTEVDLER